MHIEVSREDVLLDTGGGLKKAGWFFLEEHSDPAGQEKDQPFLLHNVDVVSTIDLQRMAQFHLDNQALATLAVQHRDSSRQLLFDDQLQLCGRRAGREAKPEIVRSAPKNEALAFSGIHVISPRLLALMKEEGIFSIIDTYLRLARSGEKILAFRADDYYWRDLGKPADLQQAGSDLEQGVFSA